MAYVGNNKKEKTKAVIHGYWSFLFKTTIFNKEGKLWHLLIQEHFNQTIKIQENI